jgi:hypothetical protein
MCVKDPAAHCDYPQELGLCEEDAVIVVTTDPTVFHFCEDHKPYGFRIAVLDAEMRGRSEIFVTGLGGFELKPSGPRDNPPDEGEEEENEDEEG